MVLSTTAAGTINQTNQTARRLPSFCTKSAAKRSDCRVEQLLERFRRDVESDTLMFAREQPPHHVCAHSAKTNHADLHKGFLSLSLPVQVSTRRIIKKR
jgi:hypothetical protein